MRSLTLAAVAVALTYLFINLGLTAALPTHRYGHNVSGHNKKNVRSAVDYSNRNRIVVVAAALPTRKGFRCVM